MTFHKLYISSSSHYNEALCLSTVCQFVSFHIINISGIPYWLKYYSQTSMYFIRGRESNDSFSFFFLWALLSSAPEGFVCVCVCVGMRMCMPFRCRNGEKRGKWWSVHVCTFTHANHTGLRFTIMGWITINVALIREAFMCGRQRGAPGDLWNLQVAWRT